MATLFIILISAVSGYNVLFWTVLIVRVPMQAKYTLFFWSFYSHQSWQTLYAPRSASYPQISPAWCNTDLHVQIISYNRTNNHSHCAIMGLSWLETMKVNMLAGGEDTAAPLTLFQDHPRLSSRSPHAASTQRKTFNWVINYTTNKTPSWFLPPLVFHLLFEAAFRVFTSSMVVACSYAVEGKVVQWIRPEFGTFTLFSVYLIL